jgi:mRNA interferase RelE/StbE
VTASYDVRISARAERDLLRLPDKIGAACVAFIFGPMSEHPYRVGGPLRGQLAGLRSARRGNYRVIYRVGDENRRLEIVHIDHRGDVYR